MSRSTVRRGLALGLAACLALGACGGDDDDAASPDTSDTEPADETTTTAEATTTTVDAAAAEAEIGEKTTEFFRLIGTGAFEEAVALLENGTSYLEELEHCRDLVTGATIEMKTVEIDGDTAMTTYDILLNGAVALEGAGGTAVQTDDGWLVGENTFLSLYDAAKDSCTGPPPPA